jgi:hypothetical protein
MASAEKMIESYDLRADASQFGAARTAQLTAMQARFAAYAQDYYPMEQQLRDVLASEAVQSALYFDYHAYFNEGYKAFTKFSGETLALKFAELVAKYTALGLVDTTLLEIRNTVFSVGAPAD